MKTKADSEEPHDGQSALGQVDAICDRFEAAWQAGERPQVAEYLNGVAEEFHQDLVRELIRLDMAYRKSRQETPCAEDYREVFPAFADVIERLFAGRIECEAGGLGYGARADDRYGRQIMPVTTQQFVRYLADSGLMTVDEIWSFRDTFPQDIGHEDPASLARELVRQHKLTEYQAEQLLEGNWKHVVFGEYVIQERLGAGGMGQIFKAVHRRMERTVALKFIASNIGDSPEFVERFRHEVLAAARLIHPNVVTAFDAGEHDGICYLVMQYVEGRDLASLVRGGGPLPVCQAVDYVIQAARGLAYAHSHGVIHRDVKPSNLVVDQEGAVRILDMGLARLDEQKTEEAGQRTLTQSGELIGTFDYMAPEQAEDVHNVDRRCDIYSLGCTLYFLLTGKPIYAGDSITRKIIQHRETAVPSLLEARDDACAELDSIFRKMVAKRPDERYGSMNEVIAELEACLRQQADRATITYQAVGGSAPARDTETDGMAQAVLQAKPKLDVSAETVPSATLAEETARAPRRSAQFFQRFPRAWKSKTAIATGGVLALVFAFGVTIWVNRTRIEVPDGSTVSIHDDGSVEVTLPKEGPVLPASEAISGVDADPQRRAAEQILKLGGWMQVSSMESQIWSRVRSVGELPKGLLLAHGVHLEKNASVTDTDLACLADLPDLGQLWLTDCPQLTSAILVHIKGMKRLAVLGLAGTGVKGVDLSAIQHLPLSRLYLSNEQLDEAGYRLLAGMDGLVDLGLCGSNVTDDRIGTLTRQSELLRLGLCDTQLTDEGLRRLPTVMPGLRMLVLNTPGAITDDGVSGLAKLESLEYLTLDGTDIKGLGLADLASLPNLKGLRVTGENAATCVKYLRGLPKLDFLVIKSRQMNDITIQPLAELKSLEELYLEGTAVSERGIAALKALLPKCKISTKTGESDIALAARVDIIDKEEAARRAVKDASANVPVVSSASPDATPPLKSDPAAWSALLPSDAPPPAIAPFDAATAKKHQEAWAEYLGVPVEQDVDLGAGMKLTMVLIPPGEFMMGSPPEEQERSLEEARASNSQWSINQIPGEGPQHRVRITRPFRLSRHEVTRSQFRQFVEATDYKTEGERDGKGGERISDGNRIQDTQLPAIPGGTMNPVKMGGHEGVRS